MREHSDNIYMDETEIGFDNYKLLATGFGQKVNSRAVDLIGGVVVFNRYNDNGALWKILGRACI